jgi:sugar-specific transcriptional regulator TrmB
MLEKVLKSLNLSEKEVGVYLSALRLGSAKISTIAKRSGMSRSTTYNLLQGLFKKGFMKRTDKASVQYFSPVSPDELIALLENKREALDNKIETVKAYLPQLQAVFSPHEQMPKVSFFEGVNGIKHIYEDVIKKGDKETFAALSLDNAAPEIKRWMMKTFTPRKVKKNIFSKVLVSSKNTKPYEKLNKKHLRRSLVVSNKKYPFEVEIDVYDGNKTAFISYDESEMMGVIIESPKIANTLKSLFSCIWDKKL